MSFIQNAHGSMISGSLERNQHDRYSQNYQKQQNQYQRVQSANNSPQKKIRNANLLKQIIEQSQNPSSSNGSQIKKMKLKLHLENGMKNQNTINHNQQPAHSQERTTAFLTTKNSSFKTNKTLKSQFLQECMQMNQSAFCFAENQDDYRRYLNENQEEMMAGIKRVDKKPMIKFPYPQSMIKSIYKDDFKHHQKMRIETFNIEKERMTCNPITSKTPAMNTYITTTRDAFQDPRQKSSEKCKSTQNKEKKIKPFQQDFPFPKYSHYKNDFLNWGEARGKLVEKRPDLPFYHLKFKGMSAYKEDCLRSDKMWHNIKQQRLNKSTLYEQSITNRHLTGMSMMGVETIGGGQSESTGGWVGNSQRSLDRSLLITTKMMDVKPLEESLRKTGTIDFNQYRAKPFMRPKSALQGTLRASSKIKQNPLTYETSYKRNFVYHDTSSKKPIFIPYP